MITSYFSPSKRVQPPQPQNKRISSPRRLRKIIDDDSNSDDDSDDPLAFPPLCDPSGHSSPRPIQRKRIAGTPPSPPTPPSRDAAKPIKHISPYHRLAQKRLRRDDPEPAAPATQAAPQPRAPARTAHNASTGTGLTPRTPLRVRRAPAPPATHSPKVSPEPAPAPTPKATTVPHPRVMSALSTPRTPVPAPTPTPTPTPSAPRPPPSTPSRLAESGTPAPARGSALLAKFRSPRQRPASPAPSPGPKTKASAGRYEWLVNIRDANQRRPSDPDYDPTTLYVPPGQRFTQFERQFWDIKSRYFDCVVFFQKGKFYELYEMDADIGHRELDLKMTDRVNMRMVGVPEGRFAEWAPKLVHRGYKLVRVDELETSIELNKRKKQGAKGGSRVIRREVVHTYTQGTLVDAEMLPGAESAYLVSLREVPDASTPGKFRFGICAVDASVGHFHMGSFVDDAGRTGLETVLLNYAPREVLLPSGSRPKSATMATLRRAAASALGSTTLSQAAQDARNDANALTVSLRKPQAFDAEDAQLRLARLLGAAGGENAELPAQYGGWQRAIEATKQDELAMSALGACLEYLEELKLAEQLVSLRRFSVLTARSGSRFLRLDGNTVANLEIQCNTRDQTAEGSLLQYLDRTRSPFGKRLFRQWVCHPLRRIEEINSRLDSVDDLLACPDLSDDLRAMLRGLPDLERLASRAHAQQLRLPGFFQMLRGFRALQTFVEAHSARAGELKSERLRSLLTFTEQHAPSPNDNDNDDDNDAPLCAPGGLFPLHLHQTLLRFENAFARDPSAAPAKRGPRKTTGYATKAMLDEDMLPATGSDPDFDEASEDIARAEEELDDIIRGVRKRLGEPRIKYRSMVSEPFQMEIPVAWCKANKARIPADFQLMSQTKDVFRYWCPGITAVLPRLSEARMRRDTAARGFYRNLLQRFARSTASCWLPAVRCAAELDALQSLAAASLAPDGGPTCRPVLGEVGPDGRSYLSTRSLRHPCVLEASRAVAAGGEDAPTAFIPNDITVGGEVPNVLLLTGPNMGGKSTLLRQACVCVLMAQIGCYALAEECRLTPVDAIFVRSGATDRIMAQQSTFMVELQETAAMLHNGL